MLACAEQSGKVAAVQQWRWLVRQGAIVAILLNALAMPAQASSTFGEWVCVRSPSELFDISFDDGVYRANNISVTEVDDFLLGVPTINLTASASNRTGKDTGISVELVSYAQGDEMPLFVASARPAFGKVGTGSTEELKSVIFAPGGILTKAAKSCVRAVIGAK